MIPDPHWLDAALAAADAARAEIVPRFRAAVDVHHKRSASPIVTEADLAAERALRRVLGAATPEAGLVGEELEDVGADRPWQWVLDPIDGTIAFACGKPTFCTLIALLHEGQPVLGVIDQPITGERWVSVIGQRTTLNGQPVHTRAVPPDQARFASTGPTMFADPPGPTFLRWVADRLHVTSWGGDAYNYALLATGQLDLVAERGLALHDWAALVPVIEGAGGTVTDWAGHPLVPGADAVLAAGDPALHAAAVTVLRGRPPAAG